MLVTNNFGGSARTLPPAPSDFGKSEYINNVLQNNNFNDYINAMKSMTASTNAMNLASAREANEYNSREAEKNRQWQEMMSNTAHQREVNDLIKAGLNPVLSAMNGNGASVTSGATAHGEKANFESGVGAFASILGAMLNQQTQLNVANINAQTQREYNNKLIESATITANASKENQDKYIQMLENQLESQNTRFGISTAADLLKSGVYLAAGGLAYKKSKGLGRFLQSLGLVKLGNGLNGPVHTDEYGGKYIVRGEGY